MCANILVCMRSNQFGSFVHEFKLFPLFFVQCKKYSSFKMLIAKWKYHRQIVAVNHEFQRNILRRQMYLPWRFIEALPARCSTDIFNHNGWRFILLLYNAGGAAMNLPDKKKWLPWIDCKVFKNHFEDSLMSPFNRYQMQNTKRTT